MNIRCLLGALCIVLLCVCHEDLAVIRRECSSVNRLPVIKPDYAGIVLPPNIAPLNFAVAEAGRSCYAEISSKFGEPVTIAGSGMSISIPAAPWKELLEKNRGEPLHLDLYTCGKTGQWLRYKTVEDTIAAFPADRYLTYRSMNFVYNYSIDLRIVERDLGSYRERLLLNTKNYSWGCCNCHTPRCNDPACFVFQSKKRPVRQRHCYGGRWKAHQT